MQDVGTQSFDSPSSAPPLETADAVARAAHLWIRSICLNEILEADERHSLAGGLVAGLCERLELDPRLQGLVAYVFALLDDTGGQALAVSKLMLDRPIPRQQRRAFEKGRDEAAAIVEMLAYHRKRH
jgi:hypothetical protein